MWIFDNLDQKSRYGQIFSIILITKSQCQDIDRQDWHISQGLYHILTSSIIFQTKSPQYTKNDNDDIRCQIFDGKQSHVISSSCNSDEATCY